MPRSSIVIPVRNDPARLAKLLESFSPEDWRNNEVLVIDDGSTDETPEVAERFGARVIPNHGPPGPSEARNLGARRAREEIVVFLDSDVVLRPGAIARLTHWLEDPAVVGVSTIASEEPENPGFIPLYCAVSDKHACDHWDPPPGEQSTSAGVRFCRWLSTRFGAMRKAVFEELGGFDARFDRPCIEDGEFSIRLARKHTLVMDPDVPHTHHWPTTLRRVLRRTFVNSRLLMAVMRDQDVGAGDVVPLSERAGRILGGLAVVLLVTAPFSTVGAVASASCFAVSAWTYRDLFGAYRRAGGVGFMLGAVVVHYLVTCAALAGAASALIIAPRLGESPPRIV